MRYIFLFLSLAYSFAINAQIEIDSLTKATLITAPSSSNINSFNKVIKHYLRSKPDSAKIFIDKLIQLNNPEPIVEIMSLRWLGEYYSQLSAFDSSALYYNRMIDLSIATENDSLRAKGLYALGVNNIYTGDFGKSKEYLSQALRLYTALGIANGIEDATFTMAVVYMYEEKHESAIQSYLSLESLIKSREKVDSVFLGSVWHNLGYLYRQVGNFEKAMDYATSAEKLYQQLKSEDDLMLSRSLIAWIKTDLGDHIGADKIFLELEQYYIGNKNNYSLAEIYMGLGTTAKVLKSCKPAIVYWEKAESINRSIDNPTNLASVLNLKASCLKKTNHLQKAVNAYKEADSLATLNDLLPVKIEAITGLASTYFDLGKFSLSSTYYRDVAILKDSLDRNTSRKNVEELEAKYQTQKKEQEIKLLSAKNMLSEQQSKSQLYIFIGISAIILIAALFLLYLFISRQKTMRKLRELDKLKSKIFANISHEFRTPLTLIKGPVEDELLRDNLGEKERYNLQLINRNANRLLALVDQLLDLSKLDAGSMQLNIKQESIKSILEALTPSFKYAAERKNIAFTSSLPADGDQHWVDRNAVEKIIINLLSNAIKYTPDQGKITFAAEVNQNKLEIRIKNTGSGIKEEELTKVFDRFYQAGNTQNGVGIGLALVKELVGLHKGSISVTSKKDDWTEFIVKIPVSKNNYQPNDFATSTSTTTNDHYPFAETLPETAEIDELNNAPEAPILLIIDDNSELRTHIKSLFINKFTVIEAKDGLEGISKAIEYIPEVIISDIMMPGKDGVELSKLLKTDERTSHIPIILLTAIAGDENELQGLETGADDYIIKPFSSEVLKMRVMKLIELRTQLKLRYSQEVILRPKDIAISSIDEKFLERVQSLLDNRLIDSSFSAEAFSIEIGMSRMQLHRKLKALVGLTTTEFVRSQRLKVAAHLLETSDINISEVGYSVGFNDPSYFTKCFKEAYDCTPTQYAANSKS